MQIFFDHLVLWGASLGLLGASVAAFLYVPSPFKRLVTEGLLAGFLLVSAYHYGFGTMEAKCQAAAEESRKALVARDFQIAQTALNLDAHLTAERDLKDQLDAKVAAYEKKLSAAGSCPVSDADRKRLRAIR